MKRKLSMAYRNAKRVKASIQTHGIKATIQKVKLHLHYKTQSPVFDLIALKPVKHPWRSTKKQTHTYDMSVIIPTYNRAHMLPELLAAWKKVDAVTRYSYEIIFSDDGSDDQSLEILGQEKALPLKVIKNTHGGASKARNSAIKAAKGEKLLIIGDDIFPNPQIINQHIEKLRNLTITDAVLGECDWHNDLTVNHLMDHITLFGCEQFSFKHFPKHDFTDFRHFYTCNISIDREFLLSEKTIFDEKFYRYGFEDIELGYRLAKKGMKIFYYPEAFGEHQHPYYDVKKFCIRQESAGEMALVFKQLHKDIEPIVQIDQTLSKWSKYLRDDTAEQSSGLYNELISFCQYIENNYDTRNSSVSKDLSVVYGALFRFAYEKGVCSQTISSKNYDLNKLFIHEFFSEKLSKSLKNLNEVVPVPHYDSILSYLKTSIQNGPLLTLEAIDLEHLNEMLLRYRGLGELLRLRLRSQTAVEGLLYRPEKGFYLHINNLRQILFFLQYHNDTELLFLSFGLSDLPYVGIKGSLRNSCISYQNTKINDDTISLKDIKKGKIIRIFEHFDANKVLFNSLLKENTFLPDDYGYFGKEALKMQVIPTPLNGLSGKNTKPVIFVFPVFLAVGGVERNTAEIIDRLKETYDFIVITFERLHEAHGSLHHQFLDSGMGIYDLTELSTHQNILEYLHKLKQIYDPQLVWICNGSPWLAAHTTDIRNTFKDASIIDQEAYDTEAGWIQLYKNKDAGLLSFNRFIAINSKIQDIFINSVGINADRVDLIYSVMSTTKREQAIGVSLESLYRKFNLDVKQKYFVFIGRLTEQKAPMDLLKCIKAIVQKYDGTYKFIIAGSGELNGRMTEYIENNDLSDYVVRFDYVENTFELSRIAEAIIFTSLFEGLSIALLEALSVGTPGLSTNVGDTKVIFDQYGNGSMFHTIGDIDEYVSVFETFIENYSFYKENAEKNKEIIAHNFSAEHISDHYLKCFEAAREHLSGLPK
ncbi:MAG: glycosyltransferase [Sulfuricurvum sp.]|uniref:glycosyltransferase n=1 Tax=Sulfuricurvum sp. TaxID=2025608 RepID=UPI003D12C863